MRSIPRFGLKVRLICLPLGLVVAMAAGNAAGAGETRAAPTRVVVVGKATINWHLAAGPPSESFAKLLERYRQVSEAHLTGTALPPADDSELEAPVSLADGGRGVQLPAELISTMFVDAEGASYCSESTVTVKATEARQANGEASDAQP